MCFYLFDIHIQGINNDRPKMMVMTEIPVNLKATIGNCNGKRNKWKISLSKLFYLTEHARICS